MFRKKDSGPPPVVPARPAASGVSTPGVSGGSTPGAGRPAVTGAGAKANGKSPAAGSAGKLAYEARRAEKAGMGLEKWMAEKDRRVKAEREAVQRARQKAAPEKKPGLLRRLLDRAHRPI